MRLRTWHLESLVVYGALVGALLATGRAGDWREWLALAGVAPLVGCAVFLLHPLWRRWYRSRVASCAKE